MNKKEKEAWEKYYATSIYFVTCIYPKLIRIKHEHGTNKGKFYTTYTYEQPSPTHTRCWGWYKNQSDAIKAIEENHTDIYEEGYYPYAVIESMPEGVCPIPNIGHNEIWFKWNDNKKGYKRIKKPSWSSQTCNWSIG